MRLPPGVSSRKLACPSQVRVPFVMPGSLVKGRNVRPVGEAHGVARRLAAPGLAAVALLAALAGSGGFTSLVILAAIVAGSVRLLETVGAAAEGRSDRFPVAMS